MVQIAAAIEYNFLDAFGLGALGDQFADLLGARQITTVAGAFLLPAR